ncbi:MAG: tRNA preQ1(34) S-adenosylmethionine ribosyltransferase-isomerase QueA [Candidatus Hydrogenedens sp.]|nr:tRNA preQ1(34) S-adenosylmethionine ribosyltransferase-isomerase QueA [Candidatus Hydrogenedens sp.]
MLTSQLDFDLPERLIAQEPAERRDASRLLVVHRGSGTFEERPFAGIGEFLRAGDALVMNDTKVIRARLTGHKDTGGKIEIFLLRETEPGAWLALLKPSAKAKPGTRIALPGGLAATAGEVLDDGRRMVHFEASDVLSQLEQAGTIPLPPYIRGGHEKPLDAERYQTVYAAKPGAVAAPTAGLHYTPDLLETLRAQGVRDTRLTLHVGYGTFKPVTAERLEEHSVDPETYEFPESSAALLNETRAHGGRILAVGTTVTRVLETCAAGGRFEAGMGETRAYIYPPYRFKGIDALQTNFHLPKSSLLALVAAFAGTELILEAYRHAIREEFRFYSYGDTMLIL